MVAKAKYTLVNLYETRAILEQFAQEDNVPMAEVVRRLLLAEKAKRDAAKGGK